MCRRRGKQCDVVDDRVYRYAVVLMSLLQPSGAGGEDKDNQDKDPKESNSLVIHKVPTRSK